MLLYNAKTTRRHEDRLVRTVLHKSMQMDLLRAIGGDDVLGQPLCLDILHKSKLVLGMCARVGYVAFLSAAASFHVGLFFVYTCHDQVSLRYLKNLTLIDQRVLCLLEPKRLGLDADLWVYQGNLRLRLQLLSTDASRSHGQLGA